MSSISDFNTSGVGDGISAAPSSIADRAKTRQRTQAKKPASPVNGDLIELTSDEEVDSVVTGSKLVGQSKPKPKPRVKAKEKELPQATKNVAVANEELPRPRPRPRPRPKPIVKRNKTALDSDPLPPHPYPFARDALPGANIHFTPSSSNRDGPELPIATSPEFLNAKISQLPPSDPPYPSTMTEREDDALPPIEILHDRDSDREGGKRASSPSSLFSAPSSKRRKRRVLDMDNEPQIDQLVSSSPPRPGLIRTPHAPLLTAYTHPYGRVHEEDAMPPTFFAGSSSSAGRIERPPEPFIPPPQLDVVDLTDLPPTIDASFRNTKSTSKKLSKRQKASKSTAQSDPLQDFDAQLPMGAFDNDELDSDFDPVGGPASKKSAKGKKQSKGSAKEKKALPKKRKGQLDGVVLTIKKTKGKGKGKESTEEVFKSREFIEDSEEDDDPLRLVGGTEVELTAVAVSHSNSKSRAVPSRSTSSGPVLNPTKLASNHSTPTAIVPASSSTKGMKPKNKKRKSVVDADDEVAEQETGAEGEDSIVVKRRRKATISVLSDEDEVAPSLKDVEGAKSADKPCDGAKRRTPHRKPSQRQKKVSQPIASENGDDGADEDTNIGQDDETAMEGMEVPQIVSCNFIILALSYASSCRKMLYLRQLRHLYRNLLCPPSNPLETELQASTRMVQCHYMLGMKSHRDGVVCRCLSSSVVRAPSQVHPSLYQP